MESWIWRFLLPYNSISSYWLYGLFWVDKFNLGWEITERDEDEGHEKNPAETLTDEEIQKLTDLENQLIDLGKGIAWS